MNVEQKIDLLVQLGEYLNSNTEDWRQAKRQAEIKNPWFTEAFIDNATKGITGWLTKEKLSNWLSAYSDSTPTVRKTVGVVMAGNIPLVGFHDWLCVFLSGHNAQVKLSSKDDVLFPHLINWLTAYAKEINAEVLFSDMLKGADAYIATGSNNSSRYFDYYFGKYPNIIRRNRTSAAVLTGAESAADLDLLADDIHLYFGMGCRNVTKIYVPEEYDFVPLLNSFSRYSYFFDHVKFRNNYDYHLAVKLLNNEFYMTKESVLLVENASLFAPISVLNYSFYKDIESVGASLANNNDLQCLVGTNYVPFGKAQKPQLNDYADGVDTMSFLKNLS